MFWMMQHCVVGKIRPVCGGIPLNQGQNVKFLKVVDGAKLCEKKTFVWRDSSKSSPNCVFLKSFRCCNIMWENQTCVWRDLSECCPKSEFLDDATLCGKIRLVCVGIRLNQGRPTLCGF